MKKSILTAAILATTASIAFAQAPSPKDDSSLPTKAMEDQPGTTGGSTDMPKAKPADSSLATKAMKDQPGTTTGGATAMPTAKPADSSLPDKAKRDQAGTSVPATDGASDGTSGTAMPPADADTTKKIEGTSDPAAGK